MKTASQIAQKLKQARYRRVSKELDKLLKRAGRNCTNQKVVQTPTGPLGVCKLDCATCDSLVKDRAEECPDFTLKHTKEQLKESLELFFATRAPNEMSARFPAVAALTWVLEAGVPGPLMEGAPALQLGNIDVWTDTLEQEEGLKEWFLEQAFNSVVVEQLRQILDVPVEGVVAQVEQVKKNLATTEEERQILLDQNAALQSQATALKTTERPSLWKRMFG